MTYRFFCVYLPNMRKKTRLLPILCWTVISLALAGCRNAGQDVPDASSVKTVRFRACAADTRTAFDEAVDGVYRTRWTENDSEVLLSLNYGQAEPSAVTPSADGQTASFEASFDASATSSPYTFYAVSPASAARAISPSRSAWSVYIAAEQTPSALSVDEAAQLLVAKSDACATLPDEVDLHFSHLTAYGRVTLDNLALGDATVRKVELVFSTPVVGEWYWAEDGTLTANGDSHTITLDTDASGDLWFACAPVDVSGETMTLTVFTSLGELTKEITFPEGRKFTSGKVARFSVDMAGIEFLQTYEYRLVTDASTLREGDELVIVNADGTYALGGQISTIPAHREQVAVQVTGGILADPGEAAVLTLSAGLTSGSWSFATGTGYLAAAGSGEILREIDAKNPYSSWDITVSEGIATVKSKRGTSSYIRYSASGARFSCYASASSQADITLFRKEATGLVGPVVEDPFASVTGIGSHVAGAERVYVPEEDQISRSYDADGKLVFALLNSETLEQLVVTGYDPSLVKGQEVTVTVDYRRGLQEILTARPYTLRVVREDGPLVWLGNGSGEGFILKK